MNAEAIWATSRRISVTFSTQREKTYFYLAVAAKSLHETKGREVDILYQVVQISSEPSSTSFSCFKGNPG